MTGMSFAGGERLFLKEWTVNELKSNAVRMKVLALGCIVEHGLILVWVFSTMGNCFSAHFMFCYLFCSYSYPRFCLCFY